MKEFLKKFNIHTNYNTYINSQEKTLPNVSYCNAEREVHYNAFDYSNIYFTFTLIEDSSFSLSINDIQYSLDGGETWTTLVAGTSTPVISAKSNVIWKGTLTPIESDGIGTFSSTGKFKVKGNVMSLLYGDNFRNPTNFAEKSYAFSKLFYNNTKLISAKNLSLPSTTLANYCYNGMFYGCTALTLAPTLLATTLAYGCYYSMFQGCSSLTKAPKLPATILVDYCYYSMFYGCTTLTSAPELPATTIADSCYYYMFYNCTSLTTPPELPATTLANSCYGVMFYGCTALTSAPVLPALILTEFCYEYMFYNCTSLTTPPDLPATTIAYYCYNHMFHNCTSLITSPELPATTIAEYCYHNMFRGCTSLISTPELPATTLQANCYRTMFYGCTSLTTAPVLPAETLVTDCYKNMFAGCTKLTYIKAMFTTTPGTSYTGSWVSNVASTGTFVKNSAAEWDVTGINGIPANWTVEDADE